MLRPQGLLQRTGRGGGYLLCRGIAPNDPSFCRIVRALSVLRRAFLLDWQMDSEFRAFEVAVEPAQEAGTPLPCPRPMIAQPLLVWTPARIVGVLFVALLSVPMHLVPAALNRRRV